jgi:hypothetical protein
MPQTIAQKLRIRENNTLYTLHAPADFKEALTGLPRGVQFTATGKIFDQIHWFVSNRAQLGREFSKVMRMLKEDVIVWVYYPKGSSGIQTDLTRDKGWDCLEAERDKLTWLTLISFDKTWSVFGFRAKSADDREKELKPPKETGIDQWIDREKKIVRVPADLAAALKKTRGLAATFDALAFSHKKEYVEWIVSAKKEETRMKRIARTVERLSKGWKNPSNN